MHIMSVLKCLATSLHVNMAGRIVMWLAAIISVLMNMPIAAVVC